MHILIDFMNQEMILVSWTHWDSSDGSTIGSTHDNESNYSTSLRVRYPVSNVLIAVFTALLRVSSRNDIFR